MTQRLIDNSIKLSTNFLIFTFKFSELAPLKNICIQRKIVSRVLEISSLSLEKFFYATTMNESKNMQYKRFNEMIYGNPAK